LPAVTRRAVEAHPFPGVSVRPRVVELRSAAICAFVAWLSLAGAARAQIPAWMTRWSLAPRETGQVLNLGPLPSVARIIVPEKDGISYGSGTLVAVREQNGLIVTNWHVVRDASGPISVLFPDTFQSPAQVLKVDQDWDLAALAIWKPHAAPMPISIQPAQPGEDLLIAGYGSGQWRASAGKCTQYVSPGSKLPMEMVEVAATARQGDSGGPIVNARGELAGVLFGSGHGATSGSYSGKVREFLTSLAPEMAVEQPLAKPQPLIAAAPTPMPNWPGAKPPPSNSIPIAKAEIPAAKPDPYGPPVAPEPPTVSETPATLAAAQSSKPPTLTLPGKSKDDKSPSSALTTPDQELSRELTTPRTRELEPVVTRDAVESDAGYTYTPLPPRGGRSLSTSLDHAGPNELLTALWNSVVGSSHFEQGKSALALLGIALVLFRVLGSRRTHDSSDEAEE
jgi:hypothetical protein